MVREQWSREVEYILACVGNAVGLGNLWRFPYLCSSSGGGAFLIPYFVMLFLCGIPLLYMELAVGQYTNQGPVCAIKSLCPFFQGVGLSTVMLSFFLATYYNVILSWALYFLIESFQTPLPWSSCNNWWNDISTCAVYKYNDTGEFNNASFIKDNVTKESPSAQFFRKKILKQSSGIDVPETIQWELALLLLSIWILVYLCLFKGVQLTGKVVYFTATFPYLIILMMMGYGVTLPGSKDGILYFITPNWQKILSPKVWVNAAAQNFNSIGIAFGSMIAFASYSNKKNNVFRDCLFVCFLNSGTSLLSGFAIFSILGFVSNKLNIDIEELAKEGPSLVFQIYPEAFIPMTYPWGNIMAFFFFFNLICLGIDSQFASVEVVLTTLKDHIKKPYHRILKRREVVTLVVCVVAYFLGLPNITHGGIYFFKLIDYYSSGISLMLIAFFEVVAINWFYGANRLSKNIASMNGKEPLFYFKCCWYVVSPALILFIMVFNWSNYSPINYGSYIFPVWADILGWFIAFLSLVCIPVGMVKAIYQSDGSSFISVSNQCLFLFCLL
ncbi:hypothetical protein HELRODRAFT_72882 [Helobdella robusta]|uniref:Transporter n=1 Tax=Helobdella robusta TaxID=6412 RepID=T1G166_HELRO|nr:hypothetical protein HELRODRAFT_72882 [Helobdella robusta]ESO10226.1 hypothetical protein HELRODRAFT_72882 [Helobdella robusta]